MVYLFIRHSYHCIGNFIHDVHKIKFTALNKVSLSFLFFITIIPTNANSGMAASNIVLSNNSTISASDRDSLKKEIDELKKEINELKDTISARQEREEEAKGLVSPAFSGFFDINYADFQARENPWAIGPVELDLEWDYGKDFAVAGALVFEDGVADVGVAFVDFHQHESKISPRGRIFLDPGFHLQLGRFDVPIGLDYNYFATPDRETISAPMTTEFIMDGGWNDDGVRVYGMFKFINYSFFLTNGFNEGVAYGGRIGFFPFRDPFRLHIENTSKIFEFGVSYAVDDTKELSTKEETIFEFDGHVTVGGMEIRGEYILRENRIESFTLSGYYVVIKYSLEFWPVYAIVNYGEFEKTDFEKVRRITYGVTYEILEYALVKFEYLKFIDSDLAVFEDDEMSDSTYSAKLVVSF